MCVYFIIMYWLSFFQLCLSYLYTNIRYEISTAIICLNVHELLKLVNAIMLILNVMCSLSTKNVSLYFVCYVDKYVVFPYFFFILLLHLIFSDYHHNQNSSTVNYF